MKKGKRGNVENKFWMTLKIRANSQIRVNESPVRTMPGFEWIKVQALFESAANINKLP